MDAFGRVKTRDGWKTKRWVVLDGNESDCCSAIKVRGFAVKLRGQHNRPLRNPTGSGEHFLVSLFFTPSVSFASANHPVD